ncbi:MAG: ribosome silencing factor [Pseudomonadota bacterium]
MKSEEIKASVLQIIDGIKAVDIKCIQVSEMTSITDYMVICSGTSSRHVKSIANELVEKMKEQGVRAVGVEGLETGEWVLVDLNDVVAHIMMPETREFYQLEKLWDPNLTKD